ncbi:MAG: DUF2461 domain-containing protein [Oscillospiraceae bacterium]|nr:DUF2461 domain-containing protein [Oscillospiraceae bacterium]
MFQGYTQETVDFMWGIRFNNDREWFLPRKEIYQQHLLQPTRELAQQVYDALAAELPDEPLLMKVSRIYRDARRLFGRGPYKDHLWFCVRTGDKDWTGHPTFYFEITPEDYSYGMGFWEAKAELMRHYRRAIETRPEELATLVRRFNRQKTFTLEGPAYARSKGEVDPLLQPWYRMKSINLGHTAPLDEKIFSPSLADEVIAGLKELIPFYRYFAALCAEVYRES